MADGKKERRIFCSGISQLHRRLDELRRQLCNTSEADLPESIWLYRASRFALALPIPYIQAAILNLLNPYNYTELLLHSVILHNIIIVNIG